MKSISKNIAQILKDENIIKENETDFCRYGLEIFFSSTLEIISILFISVFAGNFYETILFFTAFVPLRIFAGGYHADTKMRCYLISVCVYIIFTLIMKIISSELYMAINIVSVIFSTIVVFTTAPVIHRNKNTNQKEKIHYKKTSRIICIIECAIIAILTIAIPTNKYVIAFTCLYKICNS